MKKNYMTPVANVALSHLEILLQEPSNQANWGKTDGQWANEGYEKNQNIEDVSDIDAQTKHRGYSLW